MSLSMASPIQKRSIVETPHSVIERGEIGVGNGIASYKKETPNDGRRRQTVVAATGLCANLASLELESTVLTQSGFTVISVGHQHRETTHPIAKNADDIRVAIEDLSDTEQVHLTGLSMGAVSSVVAAQKMPGRVLSAQLVAPAMISPIRPSRTPLAAFEASRETFRRGGKYTSSVLEGLLATKSRLRTVVSETGKLVLGDVHHRIGDLVGQDVEVHIISPVRDCFFNPNEQGRVAEELGIKSHTVFSEGTAGHASLAYHPGVTDIIMRNICLPKQTQQTNSMAA